MIDDLHEVGPRMIVPTCGDSRMELIFFYDFSIIKVNPEISLTTFSNVFISFGSNRL
jgi:hypothetical protein